ncbi:MAG: CarD family transcriptional regulator [Synergistaceae bacterium]|nr:CarD family transcriptional regulator [Synergistaceae bacterium]
MDFGKFSRKEYVVGDYVIYGANGICRITDIRREKFSGLDERLYYVMNSVYDAGARFYLPYSSGNGEGRLRPLLSVDEIRSIIDETEDIEEDWIDNDDERVTAFEAILRGGNIAEILWLVKILHLHKIEMRERGRKFRACDERVLAQAERGVTEEFAFVLGLRKEEVIPYIVDYITAKREEGRDDERRGAGAYRTDTLRNDIERAGQQGADRPL